MTGDVNGIGDDALAYTMYPNGQYPCFHTCTILTSVTRDQPSLDAIGSEGSVRFLCIV